MPAPSERLVAGRYRLGPVIGRGGMAIVHRATDIRLDRAVAIKLLRPEVSRDPDLAQRFRREALAATVLRHPNIVACLDTGTDGDQPFLVMDLVDGEDLAHRLKRGGRLAPPQAARIGLDVARALGVAHVRGIVHRDVKPGNILLAGDGRAMVTDFGIARLAMDAEAALPGTTLGSVHYFSPEQARGATTTPASDVYSLGLVLYEALTGERPWTGATSDAIALARVGTVAPAVRARRPEVPPELDAVVRTALSPEPGQRYPSGGAMAAALEPIVLATDPTSPTAVVTLPTVAVADARRDPGMPVPSVGPAPTDGAAGAPLSARSRLVRGDGRRGPARSSSRSGLALLGLGLIGGGVLLGTVLAALAGPEREPVPSDRPSPAPAVVATASPTAAPTPTAPPTDPPATPEPAVTPVPDGATADLCDPILGFACGLGPGVYAPTRFEPAVDFELDEGWSTVAHGPDIVSLERAEGLLTLTSGVTTVFPEGEAEGSRGRPRDLIEAFVETEDVGASRVADVRIGGRRGLSVDLAPTGPERIVLYANDGATYYLEPDRTTRVVAIDVKGDTVVLVIEPTDRSTLADILEVADPVAATIRWR